MTASAAPTTDRRAAYVGAVARELADLSAEERAELVEELADHVAALLEDRPEAHLEAELGAPAVYAAELRAAAGLGVATTAPADRWSSVREAWRAGVTRADARFPWLRPTLVFLRPAWWVARAGALAVFIAEVAGWQLFTGETVLLVLAAVLVSLWLAQRAPRTPLMRRTVVLADVAAVLAGLAVLAQGAPAPGTEYLYDVQYQPNCPVQLANLYPYDAQGRPLSGVRLVDQNGNPFDASVFGCDVGQYAPASGAPVNAYPWPSAGVDVTAPTGPPASLAPLPGASSSPAVASSTPSGTPTVTPTR